MKFLLDIALGKSIYTIYFFVVLTISIIVALYLETELAINIALALVCVFGIFIIVSAVVSGNEAIESLGWPKTRAKLGICKVSTHGSGRGLDGYCPGVQYSLEVDGQTYNGNRYVLGERSYGRDAVEIMISDIESKRDNLLVSYDPADPSVNVIKPGINEVHYVSALVGVGITGMAISELCGWTHFV
jgi:hypothetical protein